MASEFLKRGDMTLEVKHIQTPNDVVRFKIRTVMNTWTEINALNAAGWPQTAMLPYPATATAIQIQKFLVYKCRFIYWRQFAHIPRYLHAFKKL